jgi:hypothetical protein
MVPCVSTLNFGTLPFFMSSAAPIQSLDEIIRASRTEKRGKREKRDTSDRRRGASKGTSTRPAQARQSIKKAVPEQEPMSTVCLVHGLPSTMTIDEVRAIFSSRPGFRVIRVTPISRGAVEVSFHTVAQAASAKEIFNQAAVNDRRIRLTHLPRSKSSETKVIKTKNATVRVTIRAPGKAAAPSSRRRARS